MHYDFQGCNEDCAYFYNSLLISLAYLLCFFLLIEYHLSRRGHYNPLTISAERVNKLINSYHICLIRTMIRTLH